MNYKNIFMYHIGESNTKIITLQDTIFGAIIKIIKKFSPNINGGNYLTNFTQLTKHHIICLDFHLHLYSLLHKHLDHHCYLEESVDLAVAEYFVDITYLKHQT